MATKLKSASGQAPALELLSDEEYARQFGDAAFEVREAESGHRIRCGTEQRGYSTPNNSDSDDLRIDTPEGFASLWAEGTTLRWRFSPQAMLRFRYPQDEMEKIRVAMKRGLALWGDACPVRFTEARSNCDFEVAPAFMDDCDPTGCVLASAFFPNGGQNTLRIFPRMWGLPEEEQAETMAHEFGHIFGLRHWFAHIREQYRDQVPFGSNSPFTIMNYGRFGEMTDADRDDLRLLYREAWRGNLTEINGTPIRFVKPYSSIYHQT